MNRYFQRRFALTKEGAGDLIRGIASHTFVNITLILPMIYAMTFLQKIIDRGETGQIRWYLLAALIILAVIFLAAYIDYAVTFTKIYVESAKRRISLAEKLKQLPLAFFDKRDVADLSGTIMTDATEMEQLFSHSVPQLYAAIVNFILLSVLLFIYDPRMTLAAVWVIPVAGIIFLISKRAQKRISARGYRDKRLIAERMQEGLDNAREIHAYNREETYLAEVDEALAAYRHTLEHAELIIGVFINLSMVMLRLGLPSVTLYGAYRLINGEIGILPYIAFLIIAVRIYDPITEILTNFAALNHMGPRIERMREMDELPVQTGTDKFTPNGYDIIFEHVDFSYGQGIQTLSDVSFIAKQGEVTALVGPSGGGKTTVTKLAGRFLDVEAGTVRLGGVDISAIDPEELLKSFSIVFQDVTLFNASVTENIRLGRKDATDEEVLAAARVAQCEDFVRKLPEGYDTLIGENGERLSGGERQRISIARAILKDAPVVLLDEATASVDVENESRIQAALGHLIQNKTVLVIAHRMRTVADVDHVVVLADGRVVESGSPEALRHAGGMFAEMLTRQGCH
ncbi:MAG: ABC transporter ATP-binding protein [Eubacteriales bacterium]|nr:ABC transporter ATP-binding protein [Eubacteriales bacterium]